MTVKKIYLVILLSFVIIQNVLGQDGETKKFPYAIRYKNFTYFYTSERIVDSDYKKVEKKDVYPKRYFISGSFGYSFSGTNEYVEFIFDVKKPKLKTYNFYFPYRQDEFKCNVKYEGFTNNLYRFNIKINVSKYKIDDFLGIDCINIL